MAICAAMAMTALAPTMSSRSVMTRPRTTLRSIVAGIDMFFNFVQHQNRRKQRNRGEAAQSDSECRSIPNRPQTGIVRDRKRAIADDGRQRGHDDRLAGLVGRAAER